MVNYLSSNIKHLRKVKGLTQEDLAGKIGGKRSIIGSYEEERAEPKIATIQLIANYFQVSMDQLILQDLTKTYSDSAANEDYIRGKQLRILPIIVDKENEELVTLVPVKAAAGYLNGYADPEYIERLPSFTFPVPELAHKGTIRAFQITGESMIPVKSNSYILTRYVENWQDIRDNKCYVLVTTDEGIVYKRVLNEVREKQMLTLRSDNPEFDSYAVNINAVSEVWEALGFVSFDLPDPLQDTVTIHKLSDMFESLKKDFEDYKKK